MSEKARELQGMADECRKLALRAKSDTLREHLLEIAEQLERVADDRLKGRRRRA